MRITRSRWFLPLFALTLGVAVFAAEWAGGDLSGGLIALAIMGAFALVVLLGGRSETIRGLRGDASDERFRRIDVHATALAGLAVTSAVIVGFLVEVARGHDGNPYGWLGAVGGLVYVAAVAFFRIRG